MQNQKILNWQLVTLPIPYDLRSMNSYIIEEPSGLTIIDTGDESDEAKDIWRKVIGQRRINRVLITHLHIDHFGLARWFQDEYNATIWMSERSYEELTRRRARFEKGLYEDDNLSFMSVYEMKVDSDESAVYNRSEPFQVHVDVVFSEHQVIEGETFTLQPLWTPGHAPDHYCFYEKEAGVLFLGDHLLEIINPIVMPSTRLQNPLGVYLETFKQLRQLKMNHALPGHGPAIKNFNERVSQLMLHYIDKCQQILNAIPAEGATVSDITDQVYAHKPPKLRGASLIQVVTYVHYLMGRGYVKQQRKGPSYYFYRTEMTD
ncbi:MBL fold metallo-hydrolase [Lysinibacillus sp. KU-BSD001]|uniref:MBL fold metallo-hydrolase n=1 Tax=Lysinibacillus sp. KU-BSD001 TaxID=3141328 RepID=UPI0036F00FB7